MKQEEALQRVLLRYELAHDMSPDVRSAMWDAQKATFTHILKTHGKYSLYLSISAWLYVWLKKLGLGITLAKSAMVVSVAAVTGSIIITGAAAYTVHQVFIAPPEAVETSMPREGEDARDAGQASRPAALKRFDLGVLPFEYQPSISREGARANLKIAQIALKSMGPDRAAFMADPGAFAKPRRALTGSVVKMGTLYRISVKLVDGASMRVLSLASGSASGEEDIDRACEELMRKMDLP